MEVRWALKGQVEKGGKNIPEGAGVKLQDVFTEYVATGGCEGFVASVFVTQWGGVERREAREVAKGQAEEKYFMICQLWYGTL